MSSQLRGAGIIGTGSFVPPRVVTNAELEKTIDTTNEWIVTRSGICERHVADAGTAASDLGLEAARRALENASLSADKLDLIICATISGDMPFPSTACLIQDRIGAAKAGAFDLQAGCSGWVYALTTASQFVRTGMYDHVLVVGVDVLSKLTDWTDRSTCVLFGDGAGAAVIGPVGAEEGILASYLGADGAGGEFLKIDAGGSRLPASEETVRDRQHFIKMEGREVFKFGVRIMGEACLKVLEASGLTAKDVDLFLPHQANIRIIDAATERLQFPEERVYVNIQNYGNTSGGSIPLALDEAHRSGKIKKGDIVLFVGFGAGLTWASTVLKWTMDN
jgi:3-oxoacyl-[acyl-carrier-protein] synthase III